MTNTLFTGSLPFGDGLQKVTGGGLIGISWTLPESLTSRCYAFLGDRPGVRSTWDRFYGPGPVLLEERGPVSAHSLSDLISEARDLPARVNRSAPNPLTSVYPAASKVPSARLVGLRTRSSVEAVEAAPRPASANYPDQPSGCSRAVLRGAHIPHKVYAEAISDGVASHA